MIHDVKGTDVDYALSVSLLIDCQLENFICYLNIGLRQYYDDEKINLTT